MTEENLAPGSDPERAQAAIDAADGVTRTVELVERFNWAWGASREKQCLYPVGVCEMPEAAAAMAEEMGYVKAEAPPDDPKTKAKGKAPENK